MPKRVSAGQSITLTASVMRCIGGLYMGVRGFWLQIARLATEMARAIAASTKQWRLFEHLSSSSSSIHSVSQLKNLCRIRGLESKGQIGG
jgi:hypothetical protein